MWVAWFAYPRSKLRDTLCWYTSTAQLAHVQRFPVMKVLKVYCPSIFSSIGFISIAPDYLALALTRVYIRMYAASESWVGEHMLAAVQQFLDEEVTILPKICSLCGYSSQGGHASMALHRNLEANNRGFTLKAASHVSGPYSISSGMKIYWSVKRLIQPWLIYRWWLLVIMRYMAFFHKTTLGIFQRVNMRI